MPVTRRGSSGAGTAATCSRGALDKCKQSTNETMGPQGRLQLQPIACLLLLVSDTRLATQKREPLKVAIWELLISLYTFLIDS